MLTKVTLQRTTLEVSKLCLGTNMFGTAIDQGLANSILDQFVALGGNFIDTARGYGDWVPTAPKGASERAVGKWLKGRSREEIVIGTKGGMVDLRVGDWRNRVTPLDIASDLTESLQHLEIDTVDLYWLHADNPAAPVQPIIDALIAHQQAKRIRYFGASNWSPQRFQEAQSYAKTLGHQGFVAVQPFWGLAKPNPAAAAAAGYGHYYEDGFQSLHDSGLPMVPYAGQSRGFFSKVAATGEESLRDDIKAMYVNDANRARLKAIEAIAKRRGKSINEVVLAYLTSQPIQTIPIIGANGPGQLRESVKAVALHLSSDELIELRAGV